MAQDRHRRRQDARADVGLLAGPDATVAYAAIAGWDPTGPDRRMAMLAAMHASAAPSGGGRRGAVRRLTRPPGRAPTAGTVGAGP